MGTHRPKCLCSTKKTKRRRSTHPVGSQCGRLLDAYGYTNRLQPNQTLLYWQTNSNFGRPASATKQENCASSFCKRCNFVNCIRNRRNSDCIFVARRRWYGRLLNVGANFVNCYRFAHHCGHQLPPNHFCLSKWWRLLHCVKRESWRISRSCCRCFAPH